MRDSCVSAQSQIASRTALTRSVLPKVYDTIKETLKFNLKEYHLAFTTDMWSDEFVQRSYMTLSCHYISNDFQLVVNILGNREFPFGILCRIISYILFLKFIYLLGVKTGENILKFTLNILKEFDIEEKLANGVMVTDNGANVVAAFKSYTRLSCTCHNLNLVMNDLFEKSSLTSIKLLVEECKKLVGYFKHSQLNSNLSKTLKQQIKTRWNSIFIMFKSIMDVKTEIQSMLLEKNEIQRIANIDFNLLSSLLLLLKIFKECSEEMSAENVPTIQDYVLWYEKLLLTCKEDVLDSQIIIQAKTILKASILKRCKPSSQHFVASFLNPPFKELHFVSEEQR